MQLRLPCRSDAPTTLVSRHLIQVSPGVHPEGLWVAEEVEDLPGFVLVTWPEEREARVYRVVDGRVRPWSGVWRGERAAEAALQFTRDRLETP